MSSRRGSEVSDCWRASSFAIGAGTLPENGGGHGKYARGHRPALAGARRFFDFHSDSELVELFLRELDRGARHVVVADLVLRERLGVPDPLLAQQRHRQPIDPRSDASVWRCAHPQRLEQEAELLLLFFLADSQVLEHALLQLSLVDPERAAGELDPVADEVVRDRTGRARIGFEDLVAL